MKISSPLRFKKHYPWPRVALWVGMLGIVATVLLLIWVGPEGYFFLHPAIDTRFPPGYSEVQFEQIEIGMTKQEVFDRLGAPFNNMDNPGWVYSEDNAFPFWDFAWLSRGIGFDEEGRVSGIMARVIYD